MQVEETSTTDSSLKPTRAGFIRSLPLAMPVDEVIERARELGIIVQPSDIHAARYYMRQASVAETASKPPTIAQQLMLGGTISAQRDQDETAGLTKIAGVRNGVARASQATPHTTTTSTASTTETKASSKVVLASPAKRQKEREPRAPARAARGDKIDKAIRAAIEISIDDVLKASPSPKSTRGGRRAPSIQGSLEEQLHSLVLRLGTQRAREIIDEIEKTALTAS